MSAVTGNTFLIRTANGRFDMLSVSRASLIPPPVTINSVVASASPYTYPFTAADVKGTSTTNGVNYNVYSFASVSTTTTYTINYSCANATTIYVLAVGGGGRGGINFGGGGGGGGVVMMPVYLPASTSQTITISVGAGAPSYASNESVGINGSNTTVTFNGTGANAVSLKTIIAYGGGGGAGYPSSAPSGGASGGGGSSSYLSATASNNNYNYANNGADGISSNAIGGGGGGAGTSGSIGSISPTYVGGNGGDGIKCFLPGICNFSPSGTAYGTYYWGGGGGGSFYSSTTGSIGGNGGLGGGGGGNGQYTSGSTGNPGVNGSGGISIGTAGTTSGNSGYGGANTGGGGGGAWTTSPVATVGAGGSGIVIIAFPSDSAITINQSAVLPASIMSSGLYSATLNNATLTSSAYNSIKGAYACRLINYNYFGPVMTLRHSLDTTGLYTQNFYSDICGNMGTGYLGTGLPLSSWLSANGANTTYAYVTKWYNQGMDVSFNCATQYTTGKQPIYDVSYGMINSGWTSGGTAGSLGIAAPQTGCLLALPNYAFPTLDNPFTVIFKHYNIATLASSSGFFNAGRNAAATTVAIRTNGTSYFVYDPGYTWGGTPAYNNAVSLTYTGSNGTHSGFINGSPSTTSVIGTARNTQAQDNWIFGTGVSTTGTLPTELLNGQLYNMYTFSTALSTADRNIIEATQSVFSQLPQMTLSLFTLSSTTFAFTWSAVSNATTYIAYINGSAYGAVTSGLAVTPGFSGPWTVNVYAYSATNNLLATGYSATPSTWFKFDTGDIVSTTTLLNYATNTYNGTLNLVSTYPSISTSVSKFGTGSITVNGTSTGYVSMTGVNFSGQMTISFWLQCSSRVDGSPPFSLKIASTYASNSSSGQYIRPWFVGSAAAVTSINVNTSTTDQSVAIASTVNITGWTHFAYVFNNTNIRVYVNGNAGTYTAFHTPLSNGTYTLNIGYENIFGNTPLTGYIDDFRIHNNILSSTQIAGIYNYNPIIPSIAINSVTASASPFTYPVTAADAYGATTTNGTNYNVYSFTSVSTTTSYTMNYSCATASTIYVLAVGGGGGGGSYVGSGGGAGGVVMLPVTVPPGTNQTITINVGTAGKNAIFSNQTLTQTPTNGGSSTIIFNATGAAATTPASITALGGDFGNTGPNSSAQIYGSGGASSGGGTGYGSSWYPTWTTTSASYAAVNTNYNFGNKGGAGYKSGGGNGGGGGAGGAGVDVTSGGPGSAGGPGIKCNLPGINDFTPSGTAYGTYYWGGGGGGGGGAGGGNYGGNGGIGGGGGGASQGSTFVSANGGNGGGSALNAGANASTVTVDLGGNAGANTGGGGSGSWVHNGGAGGSGIVLIAIPNVVQSVNQSILLTNYNMALPAQTANAASTANTAPTSWTVTGSGAYYILNGTGGSYNFNYCPYQQYFFTSSTTSVVLSQTIALTAKAYTLTYCAAVNSNYTAASQFTIAIGGITPIFTSTLTTSNTAWNVYSYTFTVPSAGSYAVTLTFGCSVGITQILIA